MMLFLFELFFIQPLLSLTMIALHHNLSRSVARPCPRQDLNKDFQWISLTLSG